MRKLSAATADTGSPTFMLEGRFSGIKRVVDSPSRNLSAYSSSLRIVAFTYFGPWTWSAFLATRGIPVAVPYLVGGSGVQTRKELDRAQCVSPSLIRESTAERDPRFLRSLPSNLPVVSPGLSSFKNILEPGPHSGGADGYDYGGQEPTDL